MGDTSPASFDKAQIREKSDDCFGEIPRKWTHNWQWFFEKFVMKNPWRGRLLLIDEFYDFFKPSLLSYHPVLKGIRKEEDYEFGVFFLPLLKCQTQSCMGLGCFRLAQVPNTRLLYSFPLKKSCPRINLLEVLKSCGWLSFIFALSSQVASLRHGTPLYHHIRYGLMLQYWILLVDNSYQNLLIGQSS